MIFKKIVIKSSFLFVILSILSSELNAQNELPVLPEQGFYVSYPNPFQRIYWVEPNLQATNNKEDYVPDYSKNELKESFNSMLQKIKLEETITDKVLQNKLFLFQTEEVIVDSIISYFSEIYALKEMDTIVAKDLISIVYGGNFQRDILVSSSTDSTRISNWYIKRFSTNEINELDQIRKKYAIETDSLEARHAFLDKDWAKSQEVRNERVSIERKLQQNRILTYNIDYLLKESLKLELQPWCKQHGFDRVGIIGNMTGNIGEIFRLDDTTFNPIPNMKFKLHHVLQNGSSPDIYYLGDEQIVEWKDIVNKQIADNQYQPWDSPRFEYLLKDDLFILKKTVEHVGETYWNHYYTYYLYELVE